MEQERLPFKSKWVKQLTQVIEDDVDCFSLFTDLNIDSNLLTLDLSMEQFTRMFSALMVGADFTYPEKSHQIAIDFLRGLHCPPPFASEPDDCVNYPLYAPFVDFFPMNPYNDPDEIPSGYLTPPFVIGGSDPYLPTDILVPFDSFPFVADWWDIIFGFLPQITINTIGDGQIELDLLNTIQGGFAVVKVGSPPNILDIILGIIDPNIWIIDLQIDIALPSEFDPVHEHEVDIVVGAGVPEQTYITFIPAFDDAFPPFGLPLRWGGGIRQVGLCGFEGVGEIMGITDLRLLDNEVQTFMDGEWTDKFNLAIWHMQYGNNNAQRLDNHDLDIADLVARDIQLTSLINSAYVEIGDNTDNIGDNWLAIAALETSQGLQDGLIAANAGNIATHDITINQHSIAIAEHADRLTALEGAVDYAGSDVQSERNDFTHNYASETFISTPIGVWHTLVNVSPTVTIHDDNVFARIDWLFQCKLNSGDDAQFRVFDGTNYHYIAEHIGKAGNPYDTFHLTATMLAVTSGSQTFELQYTSTNDGAIYFKGVAHHSVLEVYRTDAEPRFWIEEVNFDNGLAYSIQSTSEITTLIGAGGNPDDCLIAWNTPSVDGLDYFQITIPLGEMRSVQSITFDISQDKLRGFGYSLYSDSGWIESGAIFPEFTGVWTNHSIEDLEAGDVFPFDADEIRIRIAHTSGTAVCTVKIDNIEITAL